MSLVVVVRNISQLSPISDYEFEVLVGDGTRTNSHLIASGQVKGHERAKGWQELVKRVLEEAKRP